MKRNQAPAVLDISVVIAILIEAARRQRALERPEPPEPHERPATLSGFALRGGSTPRALQEILRHVPMMWLRERAAEALAIAAADPKVLDVLEICWNPWDAARTLLVVAAFAEDAAWQTP